MTTSSTIDRNFPTLRYLTAPFRWLCRSRRRVLTAMAVLLAMVVALPLWWSIQLMGLPDVGDPFDVEAFQSLTIPDDRDAMVLYEEAASRLEPLKPPRPPVGNKIDALVSWSKADPAVRRWVDRNRAEAMELYRRGAERPDARPPLGDQLILILRPLHAMALLEASRLEEQGDMAGAWGWYRTALRASYHLGRRGTSFHRRIAEDWRGVVLARLEIWSTDPRTTRAMVRQALDEAIACGALLASATDTIKREYRFNIRWLDDPRNLGRWVPIERFKAFFGSPYCPLTPEQKKALADAWRAWRREPERSRRVIRLAVANWLAYYELPPDRRPKPDPDVPGPFRFYAFGPEAPANARALSPRSLHRWFESTIDAGPVLEFFDPRGILVKEARGYRALVVLLASELYRRDHGNAPLWDEAFVGPYLKELPDDGLDGGGDAKAGGGSTRQE